VFCILINVGSGASNPNGRGRVFDDGTFEYLPLPETVETAEKVPIYKELGFSNVKFPDLPVHLDPEFKTFTYGHVKRGFGDIRCLKELEVGDLLAFYATLQYDSQWSPFAIGYFRVQQVIDCRRLSNEDIIALKAKGFQNNAHLKRVDPHVDFLIKGDRTSRLLNRAFPMAEERNPLKIRASLKDIVFTTTGKEIENGRPWYRWILICREVSKFLSIIEQESK
jgi:hypothetical protein